MLRQDCTFTVYVISAQYSNNVTIFAHTIRGKIFYWMLFKTKNNNLHRMTLYTVTKMPAVLSRAVPTFYNVILPTNHTRELCHNGYMDRAHFLTQMLSWQPALVIQKFGASKKCWYLLLHGHIADIPSVWHVNLPTAKSTRQPITFFSYNIVSGQKLIPGTTS